MSCPCVGLPSRQRRRRYEWTWLGRRLAGTSSQNDVCPSLTAARLHVTATATTFVTKTTGMRPYVSLRVRCISIQQTAGNIAVSILNNSSQGSPQPSPRKRPLAPRKDKSGGLVE